MIVTRTRLCTRLVVILLGYTPRHLLFVIVVLLVLYLYLYSCYCYSVAYVSCYLIISYLQLFLLLLYAPCLYARALPFTHTHSLGRFLTTLDLDIQILDALSLLLVFDETIHIARSLSLSLILVFLSLFSSCYFLILDILDSVAILFLHLYDIMRGCLYMILQQSCSITVSIYTLFGLLEA